MSPMMLSLMHDAMSLADAGSWASIISVVVTLYGVARIRAIRLNIRGDRDFLQSIVVLPEIHFHLQKAREYILALPAGLLEENRRHELSKHLTTSEASLDIFFRLAYNIDTSDANALVRAARYHRRVGQVDRAAIFYNRALRLTRNSQDLRRQDCSECYLGLQSCYLATWQVKEAMDLTKEAGQAGIKGCKTAKNIEKFYFLYCFQASFLLMASDLFGVVHRTKSKIRTLKII